MSAFNARIEPTLYFGQFPKYTVGGLFASLPTAVIGVLTGIWLLYIVSFLCVVGAIFFLILGRDSPFFLLMLTSSIENNNVTVETWSKY